MIISPKQLRSLVDQAMLASIQAEQAVDKAQLALDTAAEARDRVNSLAQQIIAVWRRDGKRV